VRENGKLRSRQVWTEGGVETAEVNWPATELITGHEKSALAGSEISLKGSGGVGGDSQLGKKGGFRKKGVIKDR